MQKINLVLIPGLLCSPALWAPQIRALSDIADITVADHTRHDSMREIATAILAAAPPRFALAGLSMGGYIAYEIIRQAAERVTQAGAARHGRARRCAGTARRAAAAHRARRAGRRRQGAAGTVARCSFTRIGWRDKPLVDTVLQMAIDTGLAAFKRQQTAIMARPDNRALLSTIRCPTLVLVGREDALTPPAMAQEIADGIPGARLEIIPDCGHLSTLERPAAVNRALRAWLGA